MSYFLVLIGYCYLVRWWFDVYYLGEWKRWEFKVRLGFWGDRLVWGVEWEVCRYLLRMWIFSSVSSSIVSGCIWEEFRTKTLSLDLIVMKYVSYRFRSRVVFLGNIGLGEIIFLDYFSCFVLFWWFFNLLMVDLCSKMLFDLVLYVTLLGLNLFCRVILFCFICRDEGKDEWVE